MNFLSGIYTDGCYKSYLDSEPPFLVAVVSGKRLCISEGLSRVSEQSSLFHIKYFPDLRSLPSKRKAVAAAVPNSFGVLRSDWCASRLQSRFSCIIFSLDWETVSGVALEEIGHSSMWDQLLTYTRALQSRIVVALATDQSSSEGEGMEEKMEVLRQVLKQRFADEVNEFIILFKLGMEGESAEQLYKLLKTLSTAHHKEELVRIESKPLGADYCGVRRRFKAGWHSLAVRDLSAALKYFTDAYNCLRDIAPPYSPMELRVCGTVIVMQLLSVAKALSGVTFEDAHYSICEDHIMWLELADPSTGENCTTVRFLKSLLIGECHYWLAKNTSNATTVASMGHFCACMMAFENALEVTRSLEPSEQEIMAPSIVGVECCSALHKNIVSLTQTSGALMQRIGELLSESDSLTAPSAELHYISARLYAVLNKVDETIRSVEALWGHGVRSYEGVKLIHKLMVQLSACAQDGLSEKYSEELLFSHVSLSFGPGGEESQRRSRESFLKILHASMHDVVLSYPHRGHYAPFTAVCGFREVQEANSTHELLLALDTHSTNTISVDSLRVTLSRTRNSKLDGWGTQSSINKCVALRSGAPQTVSILFELREPGVYYCSSVQGDVKCGEVSLSIRWGFDDAFAEGCFLQLGLRMEESAGLPQPKPLIVVAEPTCRVQLHVPDHVVGVEGEITSMDVVVSTDTEIADAASLILTHISGVYELVGSNTGSFCLKDTYDVERGYVSLVLDSVPPILCDSPLRLTMKYKCIKAGKYVVPITFRTLSPATHSTEIVRNVSVHISYPFVPSYTIFKTIPWAAQTHNPTGVELSEVPLKVPKVSSPLALSGLCCLVRPQDYVNEDVSALRGNRGVLLYGAYTQQEKKGNVKFCRGEVVVIIMSVECRAIHGLGVSSLEVVVPDSAVVLSLSTGALPCHVDYMEALTVTLRLRVVEAGKVSLGFARVFVSPGSSAQRIVTDIPLPEVEVEDCAFEVTLECPSSVVSGSLVTLICNVMSKTASPQTCRLTLERNGDFFTVGGVDQWCFTIGPRSIYSTRILLKPLTIGVLQLPSLYLRQLDGESPETAPSFQFESQKICVLPQ